MNPPMSGNPFLSYSPLVEFPSLDFLCGYNLEMFGPRLKGKAKLNIFPFGGIIFSFTVK